jgi:hypothetical protein
MRKDRSSLVGRNRLPAWLAALKPCFKKRSTFRSGEYMRPVLCLDVVGHVAVRSQMINVNYMALITASIPDEIFLPLLSQGQRLWYPRGELVIKLHE